MRLVPRLRFGLLPVLCMAVLGVALWLPVGLCVAATAPSLPGTEITPEDMRQSFPKPLERQAPHMPFSPGPAPLLPEAPPLRVPEPQRPAPAAPQAPVVQPSQGSRQAAPAEQGAAQKPRSDKTSAATSAAAPAPAEAASPKDGAGGPPATPSPNAHFSGQPPQRPSVEMMAGQMLMVGFSGAELKNNAPVLDLAGRGVIGGVLFVAQDALGPRNITSPAQLRVLTATLQKAAREGQGAGGVPLFLAVEQEGGMAQALNPKLGFEGGAAAAKLGRGSAEATATAARRMGLEMTALGLNFNFAPVADVNVNPLNEDIGKKFRSFSPNPAQAAAHALAFGQGMAAAGIIPCLKYFPGTASAASGGFGPAAGEAHFGPPDLAGTWQPLELTPFREILRQNWPGAVQPALAYHRGLDGLYPATLSARMLTDILREQLHFSGVIVSNDLEALAKFYPLEDALLLAVRAGADILLLPAREGIAPPALPQKGLEDMLRAGDLSQLSQLSGASKMPGSSGSSDLSGLGGLGGLANMLASGGFLPGAQRTAPEKTGLVSPNVARAHSALVQMVRDGRIPEERLRQSWHRIMKLKKQFLYSQDSRTNTP